MFSLLDSHFSSFGMALNAWRALYVSAYLFTYCRSDKRVKYLNFYTNNSNVNRRTDKQTDRPKENCLHMRANFVQFRFGAFGGCRVGDCQSWKAFGASFSFARFSHSLCYFSSLSLFPCPSLCLLASPQLLLFLTFFCNFGCRSRFSHWPSTAQIKQLCEASRSDRYVSKC